VRLKSHFQKRSENIAILFLFHWHWAKASDSKKHIVLSQPQERWNERSLKDLECAICEQVRGSEKSFELYAFSLKHKIKYGGKKK